MHASRSLRTSSFTPKSASSVFSKKSGAVSAKKIEITTKAIQGSSGRKCQLTGKRANNGYTVSFSHIRNKKKQEANLQVRVRSIFLRSLSSSFERRACVFIARER
jgi:hypothetical protein